MVTVFFEHADNVRAALRAIVSDPAHGPDTLSNPRVMASLLSDLLPDAPRETGLLAAAVQRDLAGMLRELASNGLVADVAVDLAASSLGSSTAFTPEACHWVTTEFAIALGLAGPGRTHDPDVPGPEARRTPTARVQQHDPPTKSMAPQSPGTPSGVIGPPLNILDQQQPRGAQPTEAGPTLPVPEPPHDKGWLLATPLPGPYGTRDCPRCGRTLPRGARGKPHTSAGHLWCPGLPDVHYANRGGYIHHVTSPDDVPPEGPRGEEPQTGQNFPQGSTAIRLAEVARLHAAGLLTDQEYREKRQEIIRQL